MIEYQGTISYESLALGEFIEEKFPDSPKLAAHTPEERARDKYMVELSKRVCHHSVWVLVMSWTLRVVEITLPPVLRSAAQGHPRPDGRGARGDHAADEGGTGDFRGGAAAAREEVLLLRRAAGADGLLDMAVVRAPAGLRERRAGWRHGRHAPTGKFTAQTMARDSLGLCPQPTTWSF